MSQVKPIDSVPAGERLDALVAVEVMRWTHDPSAAPRERWAEPNGVKHFACKPYSSHLLPLFFLVETEIVRRELWEQYVTHLILEVFPDGLWWGGNIDYKEMIFPLINATSEQRCRAALGAARQRLQELLDG